MRTVTERAVRTPVAPKHAKTFYRLAADAESLVRKLRRHQESFAAKSLEQQKQKIGAQLGDELNHRAAFPANKSFTTEE